MDWSVPDHRARVERVYVGAVGVYTGAHLVGYSHEQSSDMLSTELPKDEISFSLDNSDGVWNPDNPVGNVRYLMDRQEVTVRYGFKLPTGVEWIKAGTFWVNGWDTPSNGLEATFTARDLVEFMDATYTGPKAGTLHSVALAALTQAGIPSTRYHLDETLKSVDTDFTSDDGSYSVAVILQMCANAGRCVMWQTRDGILRIERYARGDSGYKIGRDISYTHPEFAMTKPPKEVIINDGLWVETISGSGEQITITNPLISSVENAKLVAQWAVGVLRHRNVLKGTFRPDPRLDVLDIISIDSKYSENFVSAVTDISYTYNGAFRGTYTCREIEV